MWSTSEGNNYSPLRNGYDLLMEPTWEDSANGCTSKIRGKREKNFYLIADNSMATGKKRQSLKSRSFCWRDIQKVWFCVAHTALIIFACWTLWRRSFSVSHTASNKKRLCSLGGEWGLGKQTIMPLQLESSHFSHSTHMQTNKLSAYINKSLAQLNYIWILHLFAHKILVWAYRNSSMGDEHVTQQPN